VLKADNLPPSCAVVTKSRNLNFLEPSGLSRPVMGLLYLYKSENNLTNVLSIYIKFSKYRDIRGNNIATVTLKFHPETKQLFRLSPRG